MRPRSLPSSLLPSPPGHLLPYVRRARLSSRAGEGERRRRRRAARSGVRAALAEPLAEVLARVGRCAGAARRAHPFAAGVGRGRGHAAAALLPVAGALRRRGGRRRAREVLRVVLGGLLPRVRPVVEGVDVGVVAVRVGERGGVAAELLVLARDGGREHLVLRIQMLEAALLLFLLLECPLENRLH